MPDISDLPDIIADSPDTLFSVPFSLVSSEMSFEYTVDEKLESIPVTDDEGKTVAIAELKEDVYYFHLPVDLATSVHLGTVYFEFRLRADLHNSWTSRSRRDEGTQAILMLSV
ncbi:hypothetical protein BH10ACI2_BH10ACI2_13760 [soil metagenome]